MLGRPIMTRKIANAFAISVYASWIERGLCEDMAGFKRDSLFERDGSDVNRLNMVLAVNLINQLRVTAAKLEFRL